MASNLPAVINNNNQLANTLRSMFMPNTNSQQQIMMMRRIFGPNFNNNNQRQVLDNNGVEDFFLKDSMLEMHGRMEKIQKTLEDMNENIKSMVELEEEMNDREEEDFWKEQREEKQEKREVKQISLLEKILKQLGNAGLGFMNEDWANTFDTGSSSFGGGMLGSLMAGSGATFLKGLLKKAGVAGMVYGAVSGAFDASRITGGADLTGIAGAGRILGSSISGLISIMTFGLIDSKDIYNFMTKNIPEAAMSVFETAKKTITDSINGVDKALEKWLGDNYKIVKTSLAEKMGKISNFGKDIASKAFSIMTGIVDKTYDYGLDLINWFDGISAPPELQQNALLDSEMSKETGYWGKAIGLAKDLTGLATGQTEKNIETANMLGDLAQKRSNLPSVQKKYNPDKPMCYAGVKNTLLTGGITNGVYLPGEHAYMAASEFEKLGLQELTNGWQTDNPNQVKQLPKGYLVVWNKDPKKANDSGHVAITLGNGREFSDHEQSLDSSIRKRGAFGFRVFAPYKSLGGGLSDRVDNWTLEKIKAAPGAMWENLKSFVSGEQSSIFGAGSMIKKIQSEIDTTSAEDNRVKSVISEANKAPESSTVKVEPVTAPSINIVNNSSTLVPQDTSTSMNPFEWGWVKALLPNRKF
jgi:hypothetical protein